MNRHRLKAKNSIKYCKSTAHCYKSYKNIYIYIYIYRERNTPTKNRRKYLKIWDFFVVMYREGGIILDDPWGRSERI